MISLKQIRRFSTPQLPPFHYTPPEYTGIPFSEAINLREQHMSPSYLPFYRSPLLLTHGKAQYLFDHTGKRYLDMFAGVATVNIGHSHHRLVQVVEKQMKKLMHTTTVYYNEWQGIYAKKLLDRLGPGFDCVYFTNSGSEANDLAMLMARVYTGNPQIFSVRGCYHGMSGHPMGLTSTGDYNFPVSQGQSIEKTAVPNTYRGQYRGKDAGHQYAADVKEAITFLSSGNIAAFICEAIQGLGGVILTPHGYLDEVYGHVRDAGGLCICDEVQTGFGRVGSNFWAFREYGVQPDIVTMAKGIGGGYPLGAVATKREIAEALTQKLIFNTYSAQPLGAAIGHEILDILEEEKLADNATQAGERLLSGLKKLQCQFPIIGDARGKGLILGLELVKDHETLEPAPEACDLVFERCKELGLLLGKGGHFGNVFRIKPPLCINNQDVDFTLNVMELAFQELKDRVLA